MVKYLFFEGKQSFVFVCFIKIFAFWISFHTQSTRFYRFQLVCNKIMRAFSKLKRAKRILMSWISTVESEKKNSGGYIEFFQLLLRNKWWNDVHTVLTVFWVKTDEKSTLKQVREKCLSTLCNLKFIKNAIEWPVVFTTYKLNNRIHTKKKFLSPFQVSDESLTVATNESHVTQNI